MRKINTFIAISSLLATSMISVQSVATEGLSANVGLTNNYLWRGLEQTSNSAAISGGIDYSDNSGFYAGTWVSNAWGGTELDLYGGFSGDINDSMSYDVGFVYFAYPDVDDSDFSEIYGSVSYTGLTVGVAVLTSASASGSSAGDSVYINADYAVSLANDAEVNFHLGNYSGDFSTDSTDFGVSISKDSFTLGLSKTDYDDGGSSDDLKFYVSYGVDFDL